MQASGKKISSAQVAMVTKVKELRAKHAIEQQRYRLGPNHDKIILNERIRNEEYNRRRVQDRASHQLRLAKLRLESHARRESGNAEAKGTGTNRHSAIVQFSDQTIARLKQAIELFAGGNPQRRRTSRYRPYSGEGVARRGEKECMIVSSPDGHHDGFPHH